MSGRLDNPAKMRAQIYDYDSALRALERLGRGKPEANLGHNTRLVLNTVASHGDGSIAIIYHRTAIVTYKRDDTVTLNSGGYHTSTTKSHMNSVLPPGFRVFARKREWIVGVPGGGELAYFDGLVLRVLGPTTSHSGGEHEFPPPHRASNPRKRKLSVPEHHQLKIALDTLKMHPAMRGVMGGPTVEEARETVRRLTGHEPTASNPHGGERGRERLFHGTLVSDKVWRAALDEGRTRDFPSYSLLGGYPLYYLIGEMGKTRYTNLATVLASTINSDQLGADDVVVDVEVNWEDRELYDDITGERITSAYAED